MVAAIFNDSVSKSAQNVHNQRVEPIAHIDKDAYGILATELLAKKKMEHKNRRLGAWALQSAHKAHAKTKRTPATETNRVAGSLYDASAAAKLLQQHAWLRRLALATVFLPCLVGLIWVIGILFFVSFQLQGAKVSARLSDTALQNLITTKAQNYKLTLVYPDRTKKAFALNDMGFKVDANETLISLRKQQQGFMNRLHWWHPIPVTLQTKLDADALHTFIAQHATITVQPAKDATLTIENGAVKVVNPTVGKEYGLINPAWTIMVAANGLQPAAIGLKTLALTPTVTTEQLASSKAKLEKTLTQPFTFIIDSKTIAPTSSDIATWLALTPDEKTKTVNIAVNSGKVLDYINKIAAADIRPPRAEVVIARVDGSRQVLVPGVNGIDVTDKQTVATNVAQTLLDGKGMEVKLPINYAAYKTITAGDYDKWIEVDLTNKRMYAYTKSDLVKTFLVSAGAPATPTVTGQFAIYSKLTQQTMTGRNADGSNYRQPNVPWINYFYKDYAIHGNYWRPLSYFGNINSSHGCVGIITSDAQWMYNWAPIGTPVIVHT